MPEEPISERSQLRLRMEKQCDERVSKLEGRLESLDQRVDAELASLTLNMQRLLDAHEQNRKSLEVIERLIHGGQALKVIFTFLLWTFGAIGTIATGFEILKRFGEK